MSKKEINENEAAELDAHLDDFKKLLEYVTTLANNKLGYPVSLLTFLGVINNKILGIEPGSLANILLNNVGDPFKDSETSLMEVKRHERLLIMILEKFYGMDKDEARGYVTTGGTEGNFAGLWWSKRYMINTAVNQLIQTDSEIKILSKDEQELLVQVAKIPLNDYQARSEVFQKIIDLQKSIASYKTIHQQLLTPTVFFTKGHTHYSIPKISEILRLNIRGVAANENGSMNLADFHKELILNLGAHPHSSIIVIANIGTTITGAIDDVPAIKKILDASNPKPTYTIHLDGALTGFVMPILKPWGDIPDYFKSLGVNSLAVSAHKYPGLSQPCGILLARKSFFERAFEKSERSVDYVGNILDVTITGSRSGLNVLMFYNALFALGLHKNTDKLQKMVDNNIEMAKYLFTELKKVFDPERVAYPYHFNVSFPRPSVTLARKYQLMLTGDRATICVLPNVTKELIDQFVIDLKLDQEEAMSSIMTEYSIATLTAAHAKSAVELFVKSFCDSEPITKHLHFEYSEYEPFAQEVVAKAVKDGMSVVAIDKNNRVIACAISEDITEPFKADLSHYPKLKPVIALLEKLSEPFHKGRKFVKGKIAHIWIAIVDKDYRGKGVSTSIDMACGDLAVKKGYDFAYAEFTNNVSEKITHHYSVSKMINSIKFEDFADENNQKPFEGVRGSASAYILGITPGVKIDALQKYYT